MNLTYSCVQRIVLLLCALFIIRSIGAQPNFEHSIPKKYRYLLSANASRDLSKTIDYLAKGVKEGDKKIQILRRLQNNWFIVRSTTGQQIFDMGETLYPVNGLWKLSDPALLNHSDGRWLTLKLANHNALNTFQLDDLVHLDFHFVRAKMNSKQLEAILTNPDILYIGRESMDVQPEARVLDLNLIPNQIHKVHALYPELKGKSLKIGVREDRFDTEDIDLAGRGTISNAASAVLSDHATEMATIIGGAGITFANSQGVAPEVQIVSSDFGDLMPESNIFYQFHELTIQNHSYGGELESFYGASAEAYDLSTHENPHLLHVMSSGNSGQETPLSGSYAGLSQWANLTGNYKNAKNNLVVGAVDTTGVLAPFSSVGPAADGRIKPELVAYSTAGTSNATALVSGISVLLQEAYQKEYAEQATSALIKALLINAAQDVGATGPDFKTGFGSADAYRSMQALDQENFHQGTAEKGNTYEISINIPEHTNQVKVTLVWNDPAANANDLVTLVNDLDLQLIDPDDNAWLPWVLNHSNQVTSLESVAIRGVDVINNVEQITLDSPQSGTYKIQIVGDKLSTDMQSFSIVYGYDEKDIFEWNYPLEASFMPYDGETGSYFRWNSTYDVSQGELSLSLDGGQSWQILKNEVDLNLGHWRWQPELQNSQAMARMTVGDLVFQTEPFVINHTLNVKSGFDCGDSLMIAWPQLSGIDTYDIQLWQDHKLQSWTVVEDTFAIVHGGTMRSEQFRIVPMFADGTQGIGSYLFRPVNLGSVCYISSFFGFREDASVSLNGSLTSTYHLSEAHFEHLGASGFETIYSLDEPFENDLEYLDINPKEGVNYYRMRLELENGSMITSDTLNIYYLNEMIALIYPNPVSAGEMISLRTNSQDDLQSRLEIFDYQGNRLLDTDIATLEFLRINSEITPGIYIYRVRNTSGTASGTMVVH